MAKKTRKQPKKKPERLGLIVEFDDSPLTEEQLAAWYKAWRMLYKRLVLDKFADDAATVDKHAPEDSGDEGERG